MNHSGRNGRDILAVFPSNTLWQPRKLCPFRNCHSLPVVPSCVCSSLSSIHTSSYDASPSHSFKRAAQLHLNLGMTWGPLGVVVLRQWLPVAEEGDHCHPHLHYVTHDNHRDNWRNGFPWSSQGSYGWMPSVKCPSVTSSHDSETVRKQEEEKNEKKLSPCRTHADTCLIHNDFLPLDVCL